MPRARFFEGRFLILGAGKSGLAAARCLHARGADVFLSEAGSIAKEQQETLSALGVRFEEGAHGADALTGRTALVLSPGIPLDRPLPLAARKRGLPILSEIDVAAQALAADGHSPRFIAITGTNGKSTTTAYLAQLLARAGIKASGCGNLGMPFADAIAEKGLDAFVIELSSYQLESTHFLRPHVTCVLNLQEDHLARYRHLDAYLKAKWRLTLLTRDDGVCFVDRSVAAHARRLGLAFPACRTILVEPGPQAGPDRPPRREGAQPGVERLLPVSGYGGLLPVHELSLQSDLGLESAQVDCVENGQVRFRMDAARGDAGCDLEVAQPCVPGPHNAWNLAFAAGAALILGVPEETVRAQWEAATSTYVPLPHRIEPVPCAYAAADAPRFWNDSKATNVQSTLVALRSFSGPLSVLLGGEPKGESFAPLAAELKARSLAQGCELRAFCFGKAGAEIHAALESAGIPAAGPYARLVDACEDALHRARGHETILLSPACASFDEFRNFEHRGEVFRAWVTSKNST